MEEIEFLISSWDVKYSIENVINNTVITMYGARWVLEIPGETLCEEYDCLIRMM